MSDLKKVLLENDNTIQFNPFDENRVYGFTLQNFEDDNLISTVHYKVDIVCIQSYNSSNFSFDINREQVYIDNLAPDLKIEQIADNCSQAIFPIRVKVSEEGDILDIINHNAIKDRWLPIKERLSQYYQGNIISEILLKIESVLVNKKLLTESISKMWFFHLYFKPLYIEYDLDQAHNSVWESPVFGNQIIKYDVQQMIEEYYSVTDKIYINIKGKSADKRTINEVLNRCEYPKSDMAGIKVEPLNSDMEVQYKLYGEDKSIFSIIGTYKTKITEKIQKTTQIEIYHLPENSSFRPDSKSKQKRASYWQEENEPVKEKNSFWSIFKLF
ncbi:hypothetical protein OA93_15645 [Flavobacterium sp. KMS]|uniref:hypothetical protein n=1 Tax=Flavobacterium sp. KMS TaxID=1566023 RepID=UPI0005800134|nr:hypothetical protein [Flavobacterium sp. KMS]KIA97028.1 hypothetical protein OA93_15645 [Flavobacterium sp. KMS]